MALDTGSRRSEKETGTWSATEVDRGCVFFHSSIFAALPESQVLGTKQRGSWGIVCHADAKQAMQKLDDSGWLLFADRSIEASAFGCDSKVMERAVDRALQEAEKRGVNALEVKEVTLHQDSGLDYASIFARGKTIRREGLLGPVDSSMRFASSPVEEDESLTVESY